MRIQYVGVGITLCYFEIIPNRFSAITTAVTLNANPKVFVSHATEDKERFVTEFARHLRSRGVDAWIDDWEIGLGQSLVDKIFEDGIKNADVFVIVLSKNSVAKKWVREELDGNVYLWREQNQEGWLCPALLKYFDLAPKNLYVQVKDAEEGS